MMLMFAANIIKLRTSLYSSLVLLVCKRHESWHFCVGYHTLNATTVVNKYPILVIQELLDELHGTQQFSKLDLWDGYHQICVASTNIPKTTFKTHSNHFEVLVMPFGLTNALSNFCSLMNDIFQPFLHQLYS